MVYYSGTEYLRDISGFSSASILTFFNKFLTEVDTKFQKFRSHDIALRSRKSKKKLTEIIVQIFKAIVYSGALNLEKGFDAAMTKLWNKESELGCDES